MSEAASNTPHVGSVAEEAARLITLFNQGLTPEQASAAGRRAAGPDDAPDAAAGSPSGPAQSCSHDPTDPSTCRSCPVCRVLAVVRGIPPEALDRAADLVDLLSDGLRSYAARRREPGPEHRGRPEDAG